MLDVATRLIVLVALTAGAATGVSACGTGTCDGSRPMGVLTVRVLDASEAGIGGANVTLTDSTGHTNVLTSGAADAGASSGVYTAPQAGYIQNAGVTLHVDAPGYQPVDRLLTASETTASGCDLSANVTVHLTAR